MIQTDNLKQKSDFLNSQKQEKIFEDLNLKIEQLKGRKRRIQAQVQIPYSQEEVWQVISDYEAFPDFIPCVQVCRRLEHPAGGIRLEQIINKTMMGVNFSSRSVFEIEEKFPKQINYQLIEGEMKSFSLCWRLMPLELSNGQKGVELFYNLLVVPPSLLPMTVVEKIISHNVAVNLLAICQRIEDIFGPQSI